MKHHETVLYQASIEPVRTDGRDIDEAIAELTGEASHQSAPDNLTKRPDPASSQALMVRPDTAGPTYYEQPLLKRSVWSIDIPLYYFLGGAAGAAMTLGAALQLRRDPELRDFSKHCHWIGIAGSTIGAVFLVHDLGRPGRFLNMVRVFRPTSPMNMGAWILSIAAPTAISAGLFMNRRGVLGALGELSGYISGAFGAGLSCYTGVLVSSSAIPVWQQARRWMPILFMASSIATTSSLLDLFYENKRANRISHTFGLLGRTAEIAAARMVEKSAASVPRVAAPLRTGPTAGLWRASVALTAAGLVIGVLSGKSPKRRRIAGLLSALGSLALRFAVHYISEASARDPRASFQQQRAQIPEENVEGQPL